MLCRFCGFVPPEIHSFLLMSYRPTRRTDGLTLPLEFLMRAKRLVQIPRGGFLGPWQKSSTSPAHPSSRQWCPFSRHRRHIDWQAVFILHLTLDRYNTSGVSPLAFVTPLHVSLPRIVQAPRKRTPSRQAPRFGPPSSVATIIALLPPPPIQHGRRKSME